MAEIPVTGVVDNWRVPGAYIEIVMAQGPATAAGAVRQVVLAMPFLSTGDATAAKLYKINNEGDAIDRAGVGSPAHRGCRKFVQINKTTKLWYLAVAETTGGAPVAGTFAVTWTTDPTASGSTIVRVCDEDCTYSFTESDTVTTIAAAVAALINGKTHLQVTAGSAAGVLTITARLKGVSQGNGTLNVIQVRTSITPGATTTVSASGAVGDTVAGADGSTTEAANLATALATLDTRRIYYIGISQNDAISYDNLCTHINNKSVPLVGLRSVGVAAYTGGLTALQTIANGDNYSRFQIVWQENSDHDMAELAAAMCAIRAKHENTDTAYNFAGYRSGDGKVWPINAAYEESDWPSASDQNDAINDGITPIGSDEAGSYVVMSVSTRSKNAAGTIDDFRACETHRLSVCDDYADRWLSVWGQRHLGKKFRDDEYLRDGVTVNPNQRVGANVRVPSQLKREMADLAQDMYDEDLLQDIAATKEGIRVLKCATNAGRAESQIDLHAIDHLHQQTIRINEVSN